MVRARPSGRADRWRCTASRRAALVLALAAWGEVGSMAGDRIEHASVTPSDVVATVAELSLSVVTQPGFIAARGDAYLRDVEAADHPDLYRCASLLEAGLPSVGAPTPRSARMIPGWPYERPSTAAPPSGARVGSDRGSCARSGVGPLPGAIGATGGPGAPCHPGSGGRSVPPRRPAPHGPARSDEPPRVDNHRGREAHLRGLIDVGVDRRAGRGRAGPGERAGLGFRTGAPVQRYIRCRSVGDRTSRQSGSRPDRNRGRSRPASSRAVLYCWNQ